MKSKVQKEVDVAIAIYPITYKRVCESLNKKLSTVVLVSGDGDLVDCIRELTATGVKTYVTSWSQSANYATYAATESIKIYLDEIYESISKPKDGAPLTNADKLRKERCPNQILVAATHKYPNPADYDKCLNFAKRLDEAVHKKLRTV